MKTVNRPLRTVPATRPVDVRLVRDAAVAAVSAAALFALIAVLDGAAGPNDISPGTAFAATLPSATGAPTAATGSGSETRSADTSAEGARPDAIR